MMWTEEMVAERLNDAARTLARMPDRESKYRRGLRASWPDTKSEWIDRNEEATQLRVMPSAKSIDLMYESFEWLSWLSGNERKIVGSVSICMWKGRHYIPWAKVQRMAHMPVHRDTLRRHYRRGLTRIATQLNVNSGHSSNQMVVLPDSRGSQRNS